ncbi:MAG: ribonuclease PH [Planctomycetaceae bacterium]|nr:ribonuclease PH [Planctomycetaceae bacterium]
MRNDGRQAADLRPVTIQRRFTSAAAGSVLLQAGGTMVLCTASVEEGVPPWKKAQQDLTGWVTGEYSMLPGSTSPRKRRDREKVDGRTTEIQRLIGRSLRSVVDMAALGPRTITIDCDVLQADGGTRTLCITGGFIALAEAVHSLSAVLTGGPVLTGSVAAVSVGIVGGVPLLDLDYSEDVRADVDFNVVMTGRGEFVEVQGTAERAPFTRDLLNQQLALAQSGIERLTQLQRGTLGTAWPANLGG